MLNISVKNIFKSRNEKGKEYRLYIAYYYRTPTASNPVRYHTALVVIPTTQMDSRSDTEVLSECESPPSSLPPSPSSPSFPSPSPITGSLPFSSSTAATTANATSSLTIPTARASKSKKATKFHTVNVPVNENGHGRVVWKHRVESEYPDVSGTDLRSRLACLMFVAVVSSRSKVERSLKKVAMDKYADEFPDYLCTTWMYEALAVLVHDKVIDALPSSPADFWEVGARFADNWKEGHGSPVLESKMAIPCCDSDGNEVPSPLGPSNSQQ